MLEFLIDNISVVEGTFASKSSATLWEQTVFLLPIFSFIPGRLHTKHLSKTK